MNNIHEPQVFSIITKGGLVAKRILSPLTDSLKLRKFKPIHKKIAIIFSLLG